MGTVKADVTLDFKGMTCPHPIVEAKKILDRMESGKVMLLISNCPATKDDIISWTKRTGNELIKQDVEGDVHNFYIKKG